MRGAGACKADGIIRSTDTGALQIATATQQHHNSTSPASSIATSTSTSSSSATPAHPPTRVLPAIQGDYEPELCAGNVAGQADELLRGGELVKVAAGEVVGEGARAKPALDQPPAWEGGCAGNVIVRRWGWDKGPSSASQSTGLGVRSSPMPLACLLAEGWLAAASPACLLTKGAAARQQQRCPPGEAAAAAVPTWRGRAGRPLLRLGPGAGG